jgi:hypothetical protein
MMRVEAARHIYVVGLARRHDFGEQLPGAKGSIVVLYNETFLQ